MLAIAGTAVFLEWRGWTVVRENIEFQTLSGTPSQTPLWMPRAARQETAP